MLDIVADGVPRETSCVFCRRCATTSGPSQVVQVRVVDDHPPSILCRHYSMSPNRGLVSPWHKARSYSTAKPTPPTPRPYRQAAPEQRLSRHPAYPEPPAEIEQKKSLFPRLWPFKPSQQGPIDLGAKDPARGVESARRVVKEGVLDPRYKSIARRVTALICALPLSIYLGYELFQRRFKGKERKRVVPPPAKPVEGSMNPA
ncbi:hypothetical protein CLAFUW4_00408 [Fulvia fulva]|uniref:Uncharacterized protein n=1 Tax=Passalora fulva TaxID=5499 RepID=A0A9Q8L6W0_PASFU|nr:uncharacterized protein CLAFUR5_00409 [Fulvia fulva]KAK4636298.1 hypothetical protein CLAFUR4_00408 [Fulvia fulva]KAK4637152.1 hypothetical protein CLAFUR0_00409 [Fulvia fulva]UJO11829.1 hypothetical protein CLAFUR5_00409 [Fulvia fulva]WPV08784.1 hypothetical protein CLAFUW4_00408 [Fulvia fulva]WPV23275.1 hypothetical protein CLAFUW7_00412 [Fulvia fulva]